MKGIINYFSTTGNTQRMVEHFIHQTNSVEFTLLDMKKLIMPDLTRYDIIGFAFPVEFFGLPRFVLNWIRYIPKQNIQKNAFLLLTFSNIPGTALIQARNELKSKWLKVIAGHALHMPDNYPISRIKGFTANQAPNQAEKSRFHLFIRIFNDLMNSIQEGHEILEASFRLSLVNYFMNIPDPIAAKRSMGFKYLDRQKCIKCAVCEQVCPSRAIHLTPYPEFNEIQCLGCWACYHHCPTQAIYTNKIRNKGHYLASEQPSLFEKLPLHKEVI